MIRIVFFCLFFFVAGCSPSATTSQVRPDQLSFPELQFHFPEVETLTLNNGMKLYLKEDYELPLVDLTVMIRGGSIFDSPEKTGLSSLFAAALETGGAGELTPEELDAELAAMAAQLSVESSSYNYTINLSLHQQDLQRGVEILADLLRRPRFDAARLELARKQLLESLRRQNDDPGAVAARLLAAAVYQGHPFGATPQPEIVATFTRDDLLALSQQCLCPENVWIGVSGAVEQSQLKELLEKGLSDWRALAVSPQTLPVLPAVPTGKVLVAEKDVPQTSIMLGHPGINKDNPDQFALQVANYILGGGGFNSRMMREIRSNRGLAYSAYSYFRIGRRLPELFFASSETKCESTVEVVSLMRQLIDQIRDEPVSAAELELAKQSLVNSFVFAFNDTHSIVSRKMRLDFFAYPDNYLETYREKISAVTRADVQRVARKYLRPEQLQIVLVGDSRLFSAAVADLDLPVEKVDL